MREAPFAGAPIGTAAGLAYASRQAAKRVQAVPVGMSPHRDPSDDTLVTDPALRLDHRVDVVRAQAFAALEEFKLDQEGQADDRAAQLRDEADRGVHTAARRQ